MKKTQYKNVQFINPFPSNQINIDKILERIMYNSRLYTFLEKISYYFQFGCKNIQPLMYYST